MTTTNHGTPDYGQQDPHPPAYGQSYPPQFAGQAPAPAPKKSRKWPWVVGTLVAIIAIGGMISGGGEDDSTATSANSNSPAAAVVAPATDTAGIGVPVRDGKFEFVVTGVEPGLASVGDNPYFTETAQGAYTVVHLTVTNTADQPQTFFQSNQMLFDDQGRKFTNDGMAEVALLAGSGPNSSMITEINPGNQVSTVVVFDLPAGATADHIELHDSAFSGGATVGLR